MTTEPVQRLATPDSTQTIEATMSVCANCHTPVVSVMGMPWQHVITGVQECPPDPRSEPPDHDPIGQPASEAAAIINRTGA